MKISYNWLRRYVSTTLPPEEIAEILTKIGLEVELFEKIESIRGGLRGLVVGEVLECVQHPNADKLHCTQVRISKDAAPLAIVCGAPNVASGQKVVVATIGTQLYDLDGNSFTIKKSKLRGEPSEGMLCAEDEIGLGTGHDGILVLPPDTPIGTPLSQLYPVATDTVFEIGLTANRADAMSHYGVARDLAAYLNLNTPTKATLPTLPTINYSPSTTAIKLGYVDPKRVLRYCGLTLRNIRIAPSPIELQNALKAIGLHPINNIVDITNFVLHETGNPLHAFDLRAFPSGTVTVQTLPQNTSFVTLDEKERKLQDSDLCICNENTPLCLAGVYGGRDSGIQNDTTDIFLEAAVFDPISIRRTAHYHALNTDASFRFERGIDPQFTRYALERAALWLMEHAGATIDGEPIDYYPAPLPPHAFDFRVANAQKWLGYDIPSETIRKILDGLEITHTDAGNGIWHLKVPFYRIDVTREADIMEELLRLGGFPPLSQRPITFSLDADSNYQTQRIEKLKTLLVGQGFHEIMSLSLVNGEDAQKYFHKSTLTLLNPLSRDLDTLRPNLVFGALDAIAHNVARQQVNLKLFEIGNIFSQNTQTKDTTSTNPIAKYSERPMLALALTGNLEQATWSENEKPATIFQLKGYVSALLHAYALPEGAFSYIALDANSAFYASGIGLAINQKPLGYLGQIDPQLAKQYAIKIPVYFAFLYIDILEKLYAAHTLKLTELPRFPEVRRDLALLIDRSVTFEQLRTTAFEAAPKLLRDVLLFDVYEGEGIPEGKKSYAVSFGLQNREKTLTDSDIENCMNRILKRYTSELGAELR